MVYLLLGQGTLLKESQRASQRVDYSTYVHDEDEGDMHYADNILPHDLHHKEVPASPYTCTNILFSQISLLELITFE